MTEMWTGNFLGSKFSTENVPLQAMLAVSYLLIFYCLLPNFVSNIIIFFHMSKLFVFLNAQFKLNKKGSCNFFTPSNVANYLCGLHVYWDKYANLNSVCLHIQVQTCINSSTLLIQKTLFQNSSNGTLQVQKTTAFKMFHQHGWVKTNLIPFVDLAGNS